jgi:hypothetical protein
MNRSFFFPWAAALALLTPGIASAEEVYLMRGGFDVFSMGINQMASQLRREGINAKAGSFASWKAVADGIIRRSKTKSVSYPIVVIGHSFGADAAPDFANYLGRHGIPVAQVIGFDAVSTKTLRKGANRVTNYRTATGASYLAGPGFTGSINHVSAAKYGVNHFSIEENRQLQALTLQAVRTAVRKNR